MELVLEQGWVPASVPASAREQVWALALAQAWELVSALALALVQGLAKEQEQAPGTCRCRRRRP